MLKNAIDIRHNIHTLKRDLWISAGLITLQYPSLWNDIRMMTIIELGEY